MKKALSFLLVLCLMFSLSTGVFAATVNLETDTNSVQSQSETNTDVTVTLNLDEAISGVLTICYDLYYDADLFTYKSVTSGTGGTVTASVPMTDESGNTYIHLSTMDTTSEGQDLPAGMFCAVTFSVADGVTTAQEANFEAKFLNCMLNDFSEPTHSAGPAVTVSVSPTAIPLADEIVLTVNDVKNDISAKISYQTLCQDCAGHELYGYMFYKGDTWRILASDYYVTISDLLNYAGIYDFGEGDILQVVASDGYTNSFTYERLDECCWFFPENDSTDGKVAVPAIIAIEWDSQSTPEGSRPLDQLNNMSSSLYATRNLRFAFGVSEDEFTNKTAAGNRLVSNVTTINVIHACEEHEWVTEINKAYRVGNSSATCTEGAKYYAHCSVCGYYGDADAVFEGDPLGHSYTYTANTDGTHTATCSRCNETVTEEHTYGTDDKCTLCGAEKPVVEHTHTLTAVEEVAATCVKAGVKAHYVCSDTTCGKLFTDAEGTTETTLEALAIPATGKHSYVNGVCSVCGDIDETAVVLTVCEQYKDGEAASVKTYTYAGVRELAEDGQAVAVYQYWKGSTENKVVATKYATLDAILAGAGITFEEGDTLQVTDKTSSKPGSMTYTYETLSTMKYYFTSDTESVEVPAALAIVWDSGSGTVADLTASAKDTNNLRFVHGVASYGNGAGKRLWSNISEITVIHPCKNHTWTETADKAYLASAAMPTCTEGATFYKHCSVCGTIGTETFTAAALGHTYTYTANTDGTHTATCSVCNTTETAAHTYVDGKCELCGAEKPAFTGYSVAVSAEPVEISMGEDSTVQLTVSHSDETVTAYNAYHFVLTYDSSLLTYKSTSLTDAKVVDDNGTLTVIGYGSDKTFTVPVSFTFTGKAAGTANVKLTAANIDEKSNSAAQDAPAANIEPASAAITITAVYNVTLPEGFTGETTVKHGEDYTFKADDDNYTYEVKATVGGTETEVTENGDGSYTVKNVTGDVVITSVKTPKSYSVTVTGAGKDDVTATATATYGTDYTFTITKASGYNYAVTVTIGGTTYGVTEDNGSYTIPGDKITGEIAIEVVKTAKPVTTTTVSFTGEGKDDVVGGATQTATIGKDFTFSLDKKDGFDYTVKLNDTVLTPDAEGKYTIPAAYIGSDTVTVTVDKTVVYTVDVCEYVKADGQSVFLVTVTGTPADGQVFAYDGTAMFCSEKYGAYAYLVFSDKTLEAVKTEAAAKISVISGSAVSVVYTGDVNKTNKIDVNDAQLVWNIYNAQYADFSTATMEMFLRADMNGDRTVNVNDAAAVVNTIG